MKAIKSLSKIIISLILALALTTLTACDVLDGIFGKDDGNEGNGGITDGGNGEDGDKGDGDGSTVTKYTLSFETDGGLLDDAPTEYTAGTTMQLPVPTKDYHDFEGWHEGSISGNKVTQILSTDTGNKTYYAKWTPKDYSITYYVNNKLSTNESVTSYTYGVGATLPVPSDSNYVFDGWYEGSMSGKKVTQITSVDHGDKVYYATSVGATFKVTLNLKGGTISSGNVTSYVFGVGATLPTPTLSGKSFAGWYDNQNCIGTKITKISATESGDKVYYAKWVEPGALEATFGGYEEGAFVEFELDNGVSLDNVTVSYKSNGGATKTLSGEDKKYLVRRITGDTVRADIVGIAAGTCEITVDANGNTEKETVTVTSYDRSGYAHFNYTSGVGGYTDKGTPKTNAQIIYVNEENKNTVSAKINGTTRTGLVNILQNIKNSKVPVIIRIVGQISAATWKELRYEEWYDADGHITPKIVIDHTSGLSTAQTYSDNEITFNTLDTSKYTKLNGLSNTLKYDSSKTEFDSCWNDCVVQNASNVTLEGIGTDATIFQWGLTWKYANSVEVRNIIFDDYTEDACSFQGNDIKKTVDPSQYKSYNIWVHNCVFNRGINYWDVCNEQDKHDGDGATDFKNVGNVTVSYNRYYYNHKTGLVGSSETSYTSNVTFHHNFYDQCESRLPMGRQANIHMYNNYYRATSGYCLSARNNMYAFVEACYFENCNDTIRTDSNAVVKLWACGFSGCNYNTDYAITNATSRRQVVNNSNFMNPNKQTSGYSLDNDSTMFYLNGDGTTKAYLTSATDAKWECINGAGVHKASSWVTISTDAALTNAFPLVPKN